ncbi:cytochrome P450 [Puerhibacterium puerhi]|uniref:cytochrome P450 n=1 Tax=Puerhibacterium puerhi TaxID=2692623 RepID=UPI00135A9244|nr:cytochrome P450 [Puerhibacterium puerhi]
MSATPVDLSARETLDVLRHVLAPMVAEGAIVRRPRATAWAERRQVDRQAARVLDGLRDRYDGAPLSVRLGPRRVVLVTTPQDVARILDGSPEPFTPATREKAAALRQFQPEGVLISSASARRVRRPLNERALAAGQRTHPDAEQIVAQVARTADEIAAAVEATGELDAATFTRAWWRLVRTVTLGEQAREDHELTDRLTALRRAANWAYLQPVRRRLRATFREQVAARVAEAEPGTLAAAARAASEEIARGGDGTGHSYDPADQVPHWLFAFDAAGMATLRALAVVAARPAVRDRVVTELAAADPVVDDAGPAAPVLPYARACVLESLRLWPTTLVILRDATEPTVWGGRTLPAGTGFAVVSGYVHRDAGRIDFADAFTPEAWLDGRADADRALVPFSAGPAECAGRDVVLFTTSHLLARLAGLDLAVDRGEHLERDPLPRTVDHLQLHFRQRERVAPVGGSVSR